MKKNRFTYSSGRYDIVHFIPVFRFYFDYNTLFLETEFLCYYAFVGVRILNK